MTNLHTLFGIHDTDIQGAENNADKIRQLHLAIDQDGEFFDDPQTRVAFLKAALHDVMGEGAESSAEYADRRFDDLNKKTPFETVLNDGPEGLKAVVSHLVIHYSM